MVKFTPHKLKMNSAAFVSCIIALTTWGTLADAAVCPDSRDAFNIATTYIRVSFNLRGPDDFNADVNLTLPSKATVLDALPIAYLEDPRFKSTVVAKQVTSFNGIVEAPPNKWILYRLPRPPCCPRTSPPNTLRVGVNTPIDTIPIFDGDYLLYWFSPV